MKKIRRRDFVKASLAAGGAFFISNAQHRVLGANETIRVGVAGIHGRGGSHIGGFQKLENVEVAYLIDPDSSLFDRRIKQIEDMGGRKPKCVQDMREALEDKDLDAISIATCNHWHCLLTIWGCQAGKDVYVEKPLSHNVHEGRIAYETARKHNRVVAYGTGKGSLGDGIAELAKQGTYGRLLVSRGLCYKHRGSIGFKEPETPPAELDYNIWVGPAPMEPFHRNLVHYNWHWFWNFGNGDIGNQGSHQTHAALHAIPGATMPSRVISIGGRLGYKDQAETANTQVAVLQYGSALLIFEVRGLDTDAYYGQKIGNTFHFEEGVVAGGKFYPQGGGDPESVASAPEPERRSRSGSFGNFIAAVRERDTELFLWDIETAHYSSAVCHLANISYRLGTEVPFGGKAKPFGGNKAANESFERMSDHLKDNGLKLTETTYRVGRMLEFDPGTEKFIGDDEANALLTRPKRPPFVVPDKVV
ncbi:MAG: Gfo/Idh/MocA family protein [Armatimonadota bacterium]